MTALEMFVGEPMPQDPKTHSPTTKTNLAHMDLSSLDLPVRTIDALWLKSQEGRLASLGGNEDPRAKAKVTFVIPVDIARSLGCEP